jgi:hypothetical protein
MVLDGVGGYHGQAELGLLGGRVQVSCVCVLCVQGFVRQGGVGCGMWVEGMFAYSSRPLRRQH